MDLVQIRWQQIRLLEASQLVNNENLQLKQRIAELQANAQNSSKGLKVDIAQKFSTLVLNSSLKNKADLTKLKQFVTDEFAQFFQMKAKLSAAMQKNKELIGKKDVENSELRKENRKLNQTIAELKGEIDQQKSLLKGENDGMERQNKRLAEEVKALKAEKLQLEEEITRQKSNYEDLNGFANQLQKSLETMTLQNDALKSELLQFEEKARLALLESQESQRRLSAHYEKMVEEMGLENQYLRGQCAQLEEQLARLSNSLIGNKSHFAKYVEVKTENLALQSKLETITKQVKYADKLLGNSDNNVPSVPEYNSVLPHIPNPGNLPARQKRGSFQRPNDAPPSNKSDGSVIGDSSVKPVNTMKPPTKQPSGNNAVTDKLLI